MDFSYTENQKMVADIVRNFLAREYPYNRMMEDDEHQKFPLDVVLKAGELGLLGMIFPHEVGGAGFGYLEYVVAIEELAKYDASLALTIAAHTSLGTNHIYQFGSEAQKKKYIPDLASGKKLAAWGLTEPNSGSDAAGMLTTAVRDGDYWVLNGTKNFITNSHSAEVAVVMAITDKEKGNHGISAFIIEKGTPGFSAGKKENKLGMRASETGQLVMDNCRIPYENLIGELNDGFKQAMKILDGGRISIAALSVGIAQGALEAAIKYAKERKQFGRPIGDFQAIQFKLADMATEVQAARLLTMKAASLKDEGKVTTLESSQAKLFASEVATRVTSDAVQIFGGYGFIKEYPVEKYYRDVKLCTIGEGTSEIQRIVIARNLSKN
ncbi:MAG: acyl-CoA dehydrogenase family protein [Chloroherpetonaceae bacterium]|nr:acyl-CoA dehydrogenase family protein [Chloroherpetonaceae bacterium]MCS7210007.1 acyl-CoA dehydrogenase family protein [Chloroherpetonaceae bacterium]